jgi:putative sterol carrier protein
MKDSIRTLASQMRPAVVNTATSEGSDTEKQLQAYVAKFRPDRAGKLKASYRFELSGDDGGVWYLMIADGKANLSKEGDPQKVDVTIIAPAKVFLEIVSGKRDAVAAYNSGELNIKGEVATAQYLLYVFE